ncbi:formiminoglutamate deiminase [Herbihabitans rhizosphaerae]|uniref:Formiminoglutamate deiminase n=1 Tax=Herbihabitans rhizosphaerae TaxID=1872711 RepID=A0A4Q7KFV1_9PSEU|nr:formimidoylglutamate deiminase [Herbihabitans rhizosphaerae]RZS32762.1 formiminoglutamate deiminase [Herbihabitans rhizosphaerae]
MTDFWCERALLPDGVARGVLVNVAEDGTVGGVSTADTPPPDAHSLRGLVFPGFANAHSHAFHRALRGRTHGSDTYGGGTFWTWRDGMYTLAERLDPDSYHELARAVYAEMALAGITCVGEFHYLHHGPGGTPYADPNAMGEALIAAAADAGIRITLLDTLYLRGGLTEDGYQPLAGPQLRFGDGDVEAWDDRVSRLRPDSHARIGSALHSVRAVPKDMLGTFAMHVEGTPVHLHLSEQPAENEACQRFHGCSPTELLESYGVLGGWVTAVHATHLSTVDIGLLGSNGVTACFCPTTEADLADGIGPARELLDAGSPLALGSDQHAVIDMLVEARALEHGERLRTGERGRLTPAELMRAVTEAGHRSLGWRAGRIVAGAPADLVAVDLDTPRTAGARPDQVILAATAADIHTVVSSGRIIARDGQHEKLGAVGPLLTSAITPLWA